MKTRPEPLAPSWLPRHQRRRIDRELRRLLSPGICSVWSGASKHLIQKYAAYNKEAGQ